jgi:uncharacterized membrane protein YiaA
MKKRNTSAYTFMAWGSFALSMIIYFISIWNVEWELVEKGLYSTLFLWAVTSAFTLAKVIRDNEEDN